MSQQNVEQKPFHQVMEEQELETHIEKLISDYEERWHDKIQREFANEFRRADKREIYQQNQREITQWYADVRAGKFYPGYENMKENNRPGELIYANVYMLDRVYGGPAEGGDYYNVTAPQDSIKLTYFSTETCLRILKELAYYVAEYNCTCNSNIYSVASEGQMAIYLEAQPGEFSPKEPYRYE